MDTYYRNDAFVCATYVLATIGCFLIVKKLRRGFMHSLFGGLSFFFFVVAIIGIDQFLKTRRQRVTVFVIDSASQFVSSSESSTFRHLTHSAVVIELSWGYVGPDKIHYLPVFFGKDGLEMQSYLSRLSEVLSYSKSNPNERIILNLSLGHSEPLPAETALLEEIMNNHVIIIAAAGNDGLPEACFPARYPRVIAVGALENGNIAKYSNYGSRLDALAEGGYQKISTIVSFRDGQEVTATSKLCLGGTSFAAPRVTALLADLLKYRKPIFGSELQDQVRAYCTSAPIQCELKRQFLWKSLNSDQILYDSMMLVWLPLLICISLACDIAFYRMLARPGNSRRAGLYFSAMVSAVGLSYFVPMFALQQPIVWNFIPKQLEIVLARSNIMFVYLMFYGPLRLGIFSALLDFNVGQFWRRAEQAIRSKNTDQLARIWQDADDNDERRELYVAVVRSDWANVSFVASRFDEALVEGSFAVEFIHYCKKHDVLYHQVMRWMRARLDGEDEKFEKLFFYLANQNGSMVGTDIARVMRDVNALVDRENDDVRRSSIRERAKLLEQLVEKAGTVFKP